MHQEVGEYNSQVMERGPVYEGMTSLSQPIETFPMSSQVSQQGDTYSIHSSPSPSPPSGTPTQGAGRQRSRSGTNSMTMQQLNKKRQRATPEQLLVLEEAFAMNSSPTAKIREMIAERIRMTERSVQIWFQNRRAKVKQMQKKEGGDDGNMYFGAAMGQFGMQRNALMRSNSLGHGGYGALPTDIKHAMRMGMNGPLTPAQSPSNRAVISRLSIETLSIGPWHRVACNSMDLICYFSPVEGRFTYYINNSSTGFKIEFPITYVRQIRMEHVVRKKNQEAFPSGREESHRARISIELTQPPLFYSDHKGTAGWQLCHDFTQGLVASRIMLHSLVGPYEALHSEMSELVTSSPDLHARLWMDEQPQYLATGEDEYSSASGDRSRRHSSAASMAPPSRPASAIPAQFVRQHLTPGPAFPGTMGGSRRPPFQAHRRTRSRSLPTAINVSDLALAASHHALGSNMVPGMKFPTEVPQYVPMQQEMLYNPSTPLRIDTSVADNTMDYYRQFTPSSNMSAQMTPVDYSASPASQVPLQSSLPFYEGSDFHPVSAASYAHSAIYPTDTMDAPAMYADDVHQSNMMTMEQFQHPEAAYTYTTDPTSFQDTAHYTTVQDPQWTHTPQVTVTTGMDVDRTDVQPVAVKSHDTGDAKMEMAE